MKKNNRALQRQQGAIAIEMIFVVLPLILIILLSFDVTRYIQSKDQLDRLGYSLSTIISQRSQYYVDRQGKEQPLNQQQVNQLATIARNELGQSQVKLMVHQINLKAGTNYRGNQTSLKDQSVGDSSCQGFKRDQFKNQLNASASKDDPAIVLFVVEICVELSNYSLFAKISDSDDFNSIYSRHVTVAR